MKKISFLINALLLLSIAVYSQGKKSHLYGVAFYNLENMFDTIHDVGKNDYEYLPDGQDKWNSMKYEEKLKHMAGVLSQLATDKLPMGPVAIGVSEVENKRVLQDLLKQPSLAPRGYKVLHYEGPDKRGIDCALFYNPKFFHLEDSKLAPYVYVNDTVHKTRGFLIATGELAGERVTFIVNHWPSRGAVSPAREWAGEQVRALKDSLMNLYPNSKLIIMGDMNDDPFCKSMAESLGAKRKPEEVKKNTDLYNPWWDTLESGTGTLMYRGKWNLFDQIVVNGNLLGNDKGTLKYSGHEIFRRDYLFQTEGKYKGYPKRTSAGGVWLDGYSDHLPVIIYLIKHSN